METLTINRKRWARYGSDKGESALLNEDGNMCCLGFLGRACGLKPTDLRVGMPGDTYSGLHHKWSKGVIGKRNPYSRWASKAATVNDSDKYSPEKREAILVNHFKKIGIELKFTGK